MKIINILIICFILLTNSTAYSNSNNFVITLSTLLLNKNKLKQLGKQAFEYAQKTHDWKILSKQLLNKFSIILSS